jgi:hypothetical protein
MVVSATREESAMNTALKIGGYTLGLLATST